MTHTRKSASSPSKKKNTKKKASRTRQTKKRSKSAEQAEPMIALGGGAARIVPLEEIAFDDTTWQHRFAGWNCKDLETSIEAMGQLEPITVRGKEPPYQIVDGFRRTRALRILGKEEVKAQVFAEMTDDEAWSLSFGANVFHKNLSLHEKVNAVVQAEKRYRISRTQQAKMFGVSESTISRWHTIGRFPEPLRDAVDGKIVTVGHGRLLVHYRVVDLESWIERIRNDHPTVEELRSALKRAYQEPRVGRPKQVYLRKKGEIEIVGTKVPLSADPEAKQAVIAQLSQLIDLLRASMEDEGGEAELEISA